MKHCFFFLLISSKAGKLFVIVNSFETQQLQKKSGYYQSVVNNGENTVHGIQGSGRGKFMDPLVDII